MRTIGFFIPGIPPIGKLSLRPASSHTAPLSSIVRSNTSYSGRIFSFSTSSRKHGRAETLDRIPALLTEKALRGMCSSVIRCMMSP